MASVPVPVASAENVPRKTYKAAFVMLIVRDISSLLARKGQLTSYTFQCPDDPHPVYFKLKILFGIENFIGAHIVPTNRTVSATYFKISLYDGKMRALNPQLASKKCLTRARITHNVGSGWSNFYRAANPTDFVDWKFFCEIDYDGIPDTEPARVTQEPDRLLQTMSQDMLSLLDDPENADVTLIVCEEKIKAHRIILSARCPFFRSMFQSGMKESRADEILINDVEPALFREVIKFIYSGKTPADINAIALRLYPVADKFLIDELKESCDVAIRSNLSNENIIQALVLADAHNDENLLHRCLPYFKANVKALKEAYQWDELKKTPDLLLKLFEYCC